jgi:hypothetical protein
MKSRNVGKGIRELNHILMDRGYELSDIDEGILNLKLVYMNKEGHEIYVIKRSLEQCTLKSNDKKKLYSLAAYINQKS